ncbi:heparinase II/III family protein [Chloroflexota bacterium]
MERPTKEQLKQWLSDPAPLADLKAEIQQSPTTPVLLAAAQREVPTEPAIPTLTYTLYRVFEHSGERGSYETPYFIKRAKLTRALLEYLTGQTEQLDHIQDLLWSLCEETSWVMPAHEEQGPRYWDLIPPRARTEPLGAHTALTREPDSIDLFAAETGAALAETVYLIGADLAPEVRQRVRQEVERRIFKPYLAYARDHWWFSGALNWNGVCNGSIALAFLRLENDVETKAEALALALEGFETYIATGFEADGGSIEGVGYWNYGMLYVVIVAELLREISGGALDLLAQPRIKQIAEYPPGMALVAPNRFINYGDAKEVQSVAPGIGQRIAERTGVDQLRALIAPLTEDYPFGMNPIAKLPVMMRNAAWWDHSAARPTLEQRDFTLPECGTIKFVGQTADELPVVLSTKAGHTDGHHVHTDIATFILNVGGETFIPDSGRGKYSKEYFRQARYENIFNNSYSHNVPRIGGALQAPGPEFGGHQRFFGKIIEQGAADDRKFAVIDFHTAYDIPTLTHARRTVALEAHTGIVTLRDEFASTEPLAVEEAFVTWLPVELEGSTARIIGAQSTVELTVVEPAGSQFALESLAEACQENALDEVLQRLTVNLPAGTTRFTLRMTPQ